MLDPTTEQRLAKIERDLQELRNQQQAASQIDGALLNRIDRFYEDFRQESKSQRRAHDDLRIGQIDASRRLDTIEEALATLVGIAQENKATIETRFSALEAGQQEQAALLRDIVTRLAGGQPKTND